MEVIKTRRDVGTSNRMVATFIPGSDFRTAASNLIDRANITSFARSAQPPASGVTTATVSTNASKTPIYLWADGTDLKWYSLAKYAYLNANASNMFANFAATSIDLSDIITTRTTNMNSMFRYCQSLESLDLSGFKTTNVLNMGDMFCRCDSIRTIDLSSLDTSNVTNMDYMFAGDTFDSLDLSTFNTSNVTRMMAMFAGFSCATQLDVSSFDTSNVTIMRRMFDGCNQSVLDLSSFNTSNVTDTGNMFEDSPITTIYVSDAFDMSSVTTSLYMFTGCQSLVGGAGTTFDGNHTNVEYARIDNPPDFPGYFTRKVNA